MGNEGQKKSLSSVYGHPRLGNVKRVQQKNQHYFLYLEVVLESQKQYDDWAFQHKKISQISDDILFLPVQHEYNQTNFCGSGGLAKLQFEDYLYSLYPEIVNRRQIKRPFNEQELLYLFYSLVKIQAILQSKGKYVGDIKPENILVNQDGYVKVVSQHSWPGEPNRIGGFQKDSERVFLSPQECEERFRRKDSSFNTYQRNQAQVFSIGLTILEAGTLKDCSDVYGYTGYSSDYRYAEPMMKQFFEIFENRYSRELSLLLKEMLASNPKKRIRAQAIYDLLRPYQYSILNLQEIQIRLPVFQSIPKLDREEKISIKRLGESQLSYSEYPQTAKFQPPSPQYNGRHSNHHMKISLGSNPPPYIHHSPNQLNPFNQSLQSGIYNPGRQSSTNIHQNHPQINYQLVNQNTNFGRQQVHIGSPFPFQRNIMQQSLPINIAQFQENNNLHKPQYITLNSMVQNVGWPVRQSNFATQ